MEEENQTPSVEIKDELKEKNKLISIKELLIIAICMFVLMIIIIFVNCMWRQNILLYNKTIRGHHANIITHEKTEIEIPNESNTDYTLNIFAGNYSVKKACMLVFSSDELKKQFSKTIPQEDLDILNNYNSDFFTNHDLAIVMSDNSETNKYQIYSVVEENDKVIINMTRNIDQYSNKIVNNNVRSDSGKTYMFFIAIDKGAKEAEFNVYIPPLEKKDNILQLVIFAVVIYCEILVMIITLINNYNKVVSKKQEKMSAEIKFLVVEAIALGIPLFILLYQSAQSTLN